METIEEHKQHLKLEIKEEIEELREDVNVVGKENVNRSKSKHFYKLFDEENKLKRKFGYQN